MNLRRFFKQPAFLKYAATGALVSVFELYFLYDLVEKTGWYYLYASALTFFGSLVISFFLRKIVVFGDRRWAGVGRQLFLYAFIWLGISIANIVVMYFMVDRLLISYLPAQFISNIFLGFGGFLFNKLITFKPLTKVHFGSQQSRLLEEVGTGRDLSVRH